MSELGVSSTPVRYGTDQTPSYRPVRDEWDMVNDPLLPQPTPRTPEQVGSNLGSMMLLLGLLMTFLGE